MVKRIVVAVWIELTVLVWLVQLRMLCLVRRRRGRCVGRLFGVVPRAAALLPRVGGPRLPHVQAAEGEAGCEKRSDNALRILLHYVGR